MPMGKASFAPNPIQWLLGPFGGLIAFYFPGHEDECDKQCRAGFLGNFWKTPIEVHGFFFTNAEAAFQGLKYRGKETEFEGLSGDEAFKKKKNLPDPKLSLQIRWEIMLLVLRAKFSQSESMKAGLLATGDSFLLEHNNTKGRDTTWSDNCDGSGLNLLGLALMLVRSEVAQFGNRDDNCVSYLRQFVDFSTGQIMTNQWQALVLSATQATLAQLGTFAPRNSGHGQSSTSSGQKLCATPGCTEPCYPGFDKCRRSCKTCATRGCMKPCWRGEDYCGTTCRDAGLRP